MKEFLATVVADIFPFFLILFCVIKSTPSGKTKYAQWSQLYVDLPKTFSAR